LQVLVSMCVGLLVACLANWNSSQYQTHSKLCRWVGYFCSADGSNWSTSHYLALDSYSELSRSMHLTLSHGYSYFFKIANHPLLPVLALVGYQMHIANMLNASSAKIRKMCTPCTKTCVLTLKWLVKISYMCLNLYPITTTWIHTCVTFKQKWKCKHSPPL